MGVSTAEARKFGGHTRPGVVALQDTVLFFEGGAVTPGGMVSKRNIAGTSDLSLHFVGRAIDWMIKAEHAGRTRRQIGDLLFVRLIGAHAGIGAEEIIWNRQIWTPSKGLHAYGGVNPHVDHVHAGVSQQVADSTSPKDAMIKWYAAAVYGIAL